MPIAPNRPIVPVTQETGAVRFGLLDLAKSIAAGNRTVERPGRDHTL